MAKNLRNIAGTRLEAELRVLKAILTVWRAGMPMLYRVSILGDQDGFALQMDIRPELTHSVGTQQA